MANNALMCYLFQIMPKFTGSLQYVDWLAIAIIMSYYKPIPNSEASNKKYLFTSEVYRLVI